MQKTLTSTSNIYEARLNGELVTTRTVKQYPILDSELEAIRRNQAGTVASFLNSAIVAFGGLGFTIYDSFHERLILTAPKAYWFVIVPILAAAAIMAAQGFLSVKRGLEIIHRIRETDDEE